MSANWNGRLRVFALMVADALCLFVAWAIVVLGYDVIFGIKGYTPIHYLRLWPIIPCFLVINSVLRLYHGNVLYPSMPLDPVEEFRRLCFSSVFLHLLLMSFWGFTRQNGAYSRLVLICACFLTVLFAQSFRNIVRALLFRAHIGQIPVALSGSTQAAQNVAAVIDKNAYLGLKVVLSFDEKQLRDVVPKSKEHDVQILLACQDERFFRAQMREFSSWFTHIEYLPRFEIFPIFAGHAISFDGIGGLEMVNQRRMKFCRVQKRLLDYFLATLAFILALPFFIVIPILVKLSGKGPVFYRAERLGRYGRPFKIWKFRSMYADADQRLDALLKSDPALAAEFAANFKLCNDPRVTPIGRILRKTSLDELPQLFNVFTGEMSLIGPRPIVQAEVSYYGEDYELFSQAKPGITGLWQCSGRSDTDYARRVALDVYYILNWSPWMDLWICVRTAISVLFLKGAY